MNVLVGTVGYHHQRDLSVGPLLLCDLERRPWPSGVVVEDLSYDPIAVFHRLGEAAPPFDRLVLVGAVDRGRPGAAISCYRWDGTLPPPEEVQERIGQALSGVVDLENLLVILEQFEALPPQVFAVEIEPCDRSNGIEPSPRAAARMPVLEELVAELACAPEPDPQRLEARARATSAKATAEPEAARPAGESR